MTLLLGCLLGLGLLLAASPVLWPGGGRVRRRTVMGGRLRDRLAQAGLHQVTIPTLAVVSLVLGLAAGALAFVVVPVLALAVAAALVGLVLPTVVITARARARRVVSRSLWPDVVDHLVSAVRSGLALPDSVVALARIGPPDLRPAFLAFERDYRATGGFGDALDGLKARLADPVADRVLETLRMSREVGGSELTAVLRGLAAYLRQDAAVRTEVEARQSWTVNAARLGVAAPWVILVLLSTRPEAAQAYNTPYGTSLIVIGGVVSLIAYRVMVRIGRLPEERRWFA